MKRYAVLVFLIAAVAGAQMIIPDGGPCPSVDADGVLVGGACTALDFLGSTGSPAGGLSVGNSVAGKPTIGVDATVLRTSSTLAESNMPSTVVMMSDNGKTPTHSGAKTANDTGLNYTDSATSSTASITKTGFSCASTGTWNGASAVNTAIAALATGGTSNYCIDCQGGSINMASSSQLIFPNQVAAKILFASTSFPQYAIGQGSGALYMGSGQYLELLTAGVFRLIIDPNGTVNIGDSLTTGPNLVNLGGQSARTLGMVRETTAATAGNTFTIQAGGATSGSTDKAGGDLLLQPGAATGTGGAKTKLYSVDAGTTGTTDRTPTLHWQLVSGGHVELLGTPPTVTSGCGTLPGTITGVDEVGFFTTGSGTPGTCVITFATAFTNRPVCIAQDETVGTYLGAVGAATTLTITMTSSNASHAVSYLCKARA